ncbi:gluconokinase [Scopulibacillus cellulosilyticus]|uniref:Gluconokinase n=1 Tax=Scopulibacillus cellulosilyticus TaxID=2665665 RepID=A0ABW2PZ90_9BACL
MKESTYMMGVDIGTTSTKAVLFNKEGQIAAQHAVGYPLLSPSPSVAEQDPDEIYEAVVNSIKQVMLKSAVDPKSLLLISFSSAMHSVIAVDRDGNPLTKSITWADNRSVTYADKLKNDLNGHDIYLRTGTPIHPMSPLSKLFWLRNEDKETFNKAYKFIGIKEYVFFKLFGEYVVDYSIASAMGMFNLKDLDWDNEALEVAGVSADQLSKLVPTTHVMKHIDPSLAERMGISAATPFVVGASDGVLSNLGLDAIQPGIVAVTIGTSGAVRTVSNRPVTDPKGRTFCYALTENHWIIGGPVNNGGMTFRWVRDQLGDSEIENAKKNGKDPYDLLTKRAEKISPGSDGLLFHPYMAGERAPLWNADARGSFFGLALHHTRDHLIRSVLEGVIFNIYGVLLALQELIGLPKSVQATGGFARSELWRQIMADIFDQNVTIPESFESSCLGAAVLGLYAIGDIDSIDVVSHMIGTTHQHQPIPENVKIYDELKPIFLSISRRMTNDYQRIADFQREHLENK